MGKIILKFILASLLIMPLSAAAAPPVRSKDSPYKIKNMAKLYVKAELEKSSMASKQQILKSLSEKGATNFKKDEYLPDPYRGNIKIDGQMVDATSKHCVILKYKYDGQDYETGSCKSPFEK